MPTLAKVLRELKVEDALLYLDQVKMAFGEKPEIYNKFLDIMKNFKAQEIDTPGVIQQVSRLFSGYNKLILGFNTFLPDGYKIELPAHGSDTTMTVITPSATAQIVVGAPVVLGSTADRKRNIGPSDVVPKANDATVRPDPVGAPVEFDHAITYVTTIKKRFAHEPETYKAFLEILHTYQKEQRSIKDVLEQVSQLFADHSDLLREFTYFLPDAVQEQAKERLSRAARESELRRASKGSSGSAAIRCSGVDRIRRSTKGSRIDLDSMRSFQDVNHNLAFVPALADTEEESMMHPGISQLDKSLEGRNSVRVIEQPTLGKIRESFSNVTRTSIGAPDGWNKFLKFLDLYSQEILQQHGFIGLITELFKRHTLSIEHLDAMKMMLNRRDVVGTFWKDEGYLPDFASSQLEERSVSLRAAEFSLCTPSYRALSASASRPNCSGRSSLEQAALNDVWVSLPAGSERAGTFESDKRRSNNEDELFELDLIIDAISTSVLALETMNLNSFNKFTAKANITGGRGASEECNLMPALTATQVNAMLSVYGEHSVELLELLHKIPQSAVPIILNRLRQAAAAWARIRKNVNLIGSKSPLDLDHSVVDFHHVESKLTLSRYLVQDIFDLTSGMRKHDTKQHNSVILPLGRSSIHQVLFHLIHGAVEQSSVVRDDKKLIMEFWQHFFSRFVRLSTEDVMKTAHNNMTYQTLPLSTLSASRRHVKMTTDHPAQAESVGLEPKASFDYAKTGFLLATQDIYLFFRLYQLLFQRFEFSYRAWEELHTDDGIQLSLLSSMVENFVLGSLSPHHYKDGCQSLLGAASCLLSSVDILVVQILKQLQHVVNDVQSCKLLDHWHKRKHQRCQDQPRAPSSHEIFKNVQKDTDFPTPVYSTLYAIQYHFQSRVSQGSWPTDAISVEVIGTYASTLQQD